MTDSRTNLTDEQLEHLERIALIPNRDVNIPTMQLRQLVREHRELREMLATPMPCGFEEPQLVVECGHGAIDVVMLDGSRYERDEAIAIGAALIRAARGPR